ncbi:MAG TPA: hypothetical protein VG847_14505 [Chitinophagaceae bacterium]|nr:hypothetical protein [Chitinophagaceae bacterium]
MYKRLNELNFVIGLFFLLAAVILVVDYFFSNYSDETINLYTGAVFFVFGAAMMILKGKESEET